MFFFFKQKTAYEMRISDWSSDVCSSDLQIDPVLMADRFPYYDLDGRLVADAHEIAELAAGHEEPIGRAYWTAFNALPHVRKAEGELLEAYVRGSTRHMLAKY